MQDDAPNAVAAVPVAKRTALASASLIVARLMGRGIDFLALLLLARLLTPADFGVVAVAMSLILIVEAVFELPVGQVLLVEKALNRSLLDTAFTLSIVRGLVLALVVVAAAWPFTLFYQDQRLLPLICVLALAPAMRGIQNPGMIAFDRALDVKRQVTVDVGSKAGGSIVAGVVAYATGSYWALACGTVLTPLLALVMSFALVRYRPHLTLTEWRLFGSFLGWISAGQVFSALTWQVDRLVLGWAMDKPTVGRFTIADNLSALPGQVLLTPVIGPLSISLSAVRDDEERLRMAYLKLMSTVALISFPALTGLALLGEPFVRVALGPAWGNAGEILRWLALAAIPSMLWTPFNTLALALRKSWLVFSRQLLDFVVKVPIAIALITSHGVIGACAARGVATSVIGVASLLTARKIIALPLRDQLDAIARPFLGSGVMAVMLYWPISHIPNDATSLLLAAIILGLAVTGILVYVITVYISWQVVGRPPGGESLLQGLLKKAARTDGA